MGLNFFQGKCYWEKWDYNLINVEQARLVRMHSETWNEYMGADMFSLTAGSHWQRKHRKVRAVCSAPMLNNVEANTVRKAPHATHHGDFVSYILCANRKPSCQQEVSQR